MESLSSKQQLSTRVKIKGYALIISFFTLLSRILGALRDIVLLHFFGAGAVYDAFIVALTIPNALRRLTAEGSLSMVFVPLYIDIKKNNGEKDAKLFTQKIASLVIVFCTMLCALGIGFSEELVHLFASGFEKDSEKFLLSVSLTQIMFPYLVFISLVALAMGVLNSEQRFAAPAAAPMLLNICIIIAALFFREFFHYPIEAVAWAVFIAGVLQLLLQIPFLLSIKQSIVPKSFLHDDNIKRMIRLMLPTLFGVAVYQINIIILRNIASGLPDGHITYYNIASRLQELLIGVFAFAYANASLPEFSKHSSNKDWQKAFQTLRQSISSAMFIVLPATIGLAAFSLPIVSILFLHGEFTWQDAQISAKALQFIAIGIPALSLIRILVSIFFAMQDTRSPVIASMLSLAVTGSLGWYFAESYQVIGLVLALSLGVWAQAALLFLLLSFKNPLALSSFPALALLKYLTLSIPLGIVVHFAQAYGTWENGAASAMNMLYFTSIILFSALTYLVTLLLMRDRNAWDFWSLLSRLKL